MNYLIFSILLFLFVVSYSPVISAQDDDSPSDPSILNNEDDITKSTPIINQESDDDDIIPTTPSIIKESSQDISDPTDATDKKQDVGMRFVGFQGQLYTIPAQSGEVYNLITFPNFQLNARFVYLLAGECPEGVYRKSNATCPARSGTYIDQLGLSVGHENILIETHPKSLNVRMSDSKSRFSNALNVGARVQLRGHRHEMKASHITKEDDDDESQTNSNNAHMDMSYVPNMQNSTIHFDQFNHMMVTTPLFSVTIVNIAHSGYLDMTITLLRGDWIRMGQTPSTSKRPAEYPKIPIHGLLGQTWKNTWNANDRVYEGDVIDYLITSKDPFGTSFEYNLYNPNL